MPDIYDLAGGAMWGNKCDNVLCVWRPFHRSDPTNPKVTFCSQKIKKQRQCGIPGKTDVIFDPKTMRYYEDTNEYIHYNPMDKRKDTKLNPLPDERIEFNARETVPF